MGDALDRKWECVCWYSKPVTEPDSFRQVNCILRAPPLLASRGCRELERWFCAVSHTAAQWGMSLSWPASLE